MTIKHGILAFVTASALASVPAFAQEQDSASAAGSQPEPMDQQSAAMGSDPAMGGEQDMQTSGSMQTDGMGQGMSEESMSAGSQPSMSMEPAGGSQDVPPPVAQSMVRELQQALQEQGQDIRVDGIWGSQTSQALRQFQQDQNIEATGQVDMATIRALDMQQTRASAPQGQEQQQASAGESLQ